MNRIYGFFDECKRRYNVKVWRQFCDVFQQLPCVALIDDKIICMHGGISPDLTSLEQLKSVKRPLEIGDSGLMCDILWSDPDDDVEGWDENERGVSYIFGPKIVTKFLKKHDLDLICRAH